MRAAAKTVAVLMVVTAAVCMSMTTLWARAPLQGYPRGIEGLSEETVPTEVVLAGMEAFQDHYNANKTAKSAASYTDACDFTVNDGGVFAGHTPDEVSGFLGQLRNKLNGTNIKFSVINITGNVHDDVWVADNGAGSCHATWEKVGDEWKIVKDEVKFTPLEGGKNKDGVPTEVVMKAMKAFEKSYNDNKTSEASEAYAADCDVTVNGGEVFAGKTREEVAGFLDMLRNSLEGKNIKFAVTKVKGNVHEDFWVADNGAGSCLATWEEVDGEWKIIKDEINFTPKVVAAEQEPESSGADDAGEKESE